MLFSLKAWFPTYIFVCLVLFTDSVAKVFIAQYLLSMSLRRTRPWIQSPAPRETKKKGKKALSTEWKGGGRVSLGGHMARNTAK